jgi:hypothetical protein
MSTRNRSDARSKGLRLAAKVATVGGLALGGLGLAEARAASTSTASEAVAAASDDTQPLPMEGMVKARGGNCGCAPCWGPPAPPSRSRDRAHEAAS